MDITTDTAEISIFDEIGGFGIAVADFKKDFDAVKNAKSIHLMLNTPGGAVTDGMAVYNILAGVRDKLDVEIIGLAASMGSVIALAGRRLSMDEGTYFMIHNPWTISWGDADQLRHDAEVLDKMRREIVSIYVAHSNKSAQDIEAMMAGFADSVNTSVKAAALCDVSRYGFMHTPFSPQAQGGLKACKTIRDYEAFLRDAGASLQEAKALASGGWKALHRDDAMADAEDTADIAAGIRELAQIFR